MNEGAKSVFGNELSAGANFQTRNGLSEATNAISVNENNAKTIVTRNGNSEESDFYTMLSSLEGGHMSEETPTRADIQTVQALKQLYDTTNSTYNPTESLEKMNAMENMNAKKRARLNHGISNLNASIAGPVNDWIKMNTTRILNGSRTIRLNTSQKSQGNPKLREGGHRLEYGNLQSQTDGYNSQLYSYKEFREGYHSAQSNSLPLKASPSSSSGSQSSASSRSSTSSKDSTNSKSSASGSSSSNSASSA